MVSVLATSGYGRRPPGRPGVVAGAGSASGVPGATATRYCFSCCITLCPWRGPVCTSPASRG